jgi:hypothetical protein
MLEQVGIRLSNVKKSLARTSDISMGCTDRCTKRHVQLARLVQ